MLQLALDVVCKEEGRFWIVSVKMQPVLLGSYSVSEEVVWFDTGVL
jgi:hypothetical protein